MRAGAGRFWFSYPLGAALHAQGQADKSSKELQGEWRAVEYQIGGNPAPKAVVEKARLVIAGDQMTWNSGGTSVRQSRIRLDASKSPKEIDLTALDGPGTSTTYPGIYSLEKGRLRLCYSHTKDRPRSFATERGGLQELIILERVNPK
jgi:uncharacterized protein (TIGR03067 family)